MNIIAVDDERAALWAVERAVKRAKPKADISCFRAAGEALDYAKNNKVDVAFLDIEMNEMNGLLLAKNLKDIYGDTNIIFVTGYTDYLRSAFDMHASGYVVKPVDDANIANELDDLRNPVKQSDEGIRVQCFGNFEIFADGKAVLFSRSKSKEALAYLVDRKGAGVSKKELAAVLREDAEYTRSTQAYIHNIITDMIASLKAAGAEDIVIKAHNNFSVDISRFSCDLYQYEKGETAAVNSYRGEYMSNYSWAEFTTGGLMRENKYK